MMINLFFIDIAIAGSMNGVTRCVQLLADSFSKERGFRVTWIRFESKMTKAIIRRQNEGYLLIEIPLPEDLGSFLCSPARKQAYWNDAYESISQEMMPQGRMILHLHTLNLIDFALIVRHHQPCKIVSHLHCIPWKALYNRNPTHFMHLYEMYYIKKDYSKPQAFITHSHERLSYTQSDCIICVTRCARDFIRKMCPHHSAIHVVYNGISDLILDETALCRHSHQPINCLFVGNAHASKGLEFVLQALDRLLMKYEISIYVAGGYSYALREEIISRHPFLNIWFTGLLPMSKLQDYYLSCDIGLIASLQEQCSYVAIEMMMFGMPVITTNVDGLHELFAKKGCCISIPVQNNPGGLLQPDIEKMPTAISSLACQPKMREQMGHKARERYKRFYKKDKMIQSIKNIYLSL